MTDQDKWQDIRIKQDAKIALMHHFGSYVRSWTAVFVTVAILVFTVVQVREFLSTLFWIILIPIGSQIPYSMMRWAWHGALCERVIDIEPENDENLGTYLLRLHDAITLRTPGIPASWGLRFLSYTGQWPLWLAWTAIFALVGIIVAILTYAH